MMRPSLTLIVSSIFLAFILNAIYSMVLLYQPPTCIPGEICYHSLLNTKPKLDLILFTSESIRGKAELLILDKKSFNYNEHFEQDITVEISRNTRSNGTLYIHALIVPPLSRLNHYSNKPFLNELRRMSDVTHIYAPLTKFTIPKSRTFNLMKDESIKDNNIIKPTTHLMTKFALMMANTQLSIPYSNIPPELVRFLRINRQEQFLPIITEDILQSRINDLEEIMPDSTHMNFTFTYDPCSIGKLKFMVQMEATLINFVQLGFTDKDMDEIKGVFADTNLYLLCLTLFIASIHLLLDFLSFKNDVSFWRANKSMAGLSSRTVIWRVFSQTVIFFYLLDEGTSLLILIPSGIGNVIEFWKLKKVFKMTIGWKGIKINNKQNETEAEARTRKYDDESMRYLSYLLYPLCFCGAVYSLLYQPHKSWYSWTLNSLVNGVYLFGFLFMLPQLFVNYRLKSVAALPWRAFTYKAFNTFIDDIFAFIITMPTSHRIACFRDDIVFLVYLYQRWLYPVDKSRVDVGTGDPIVTEETDKKND